MTLTQLLFSLNGRVGRKTYWLFLLALFAILLVPAFAIVGISTDVADAYVTIATLLMIWPTLAVQAKRWHDREKSAWWLLINLIPIIGGLWALVENGFLAGTAGDNRYGSDPLQQYKQA